MLTLKRELLRELAPNVEAAAAVRGGDTSMCINTKETCLGDMDDALRAFLGRTQMSWGCVGRIIFRDLGDSREIEFDLHPSPEFLEMEQLRIRTERQQ